MKREYNSQAFTPEEVEKGLHLKLLNCLLELNKESEKHYNDIHITTDSYCTIIEWESVPYSHEYGGRFEYIDDDHVVMFEGHFPDGHYDYFFSEEDFKEHLNEWLKENPEWVKNKFGIYTEVD